MEEKTKSENLLEEPKKKDNKKRTIIIIIAAVLLIGVAAFGYVSIQNNKKADAQKAAFDNVTVEVKDDYSETIPLTNDEVLIDTKDLIEVLKNGKTDKDTKVIKASRDSIDTSKEGGYTITYTIETVDSLGNKATKDYKKTFTVTNTDEVAPVIKFNKDTVEITVGDTYDPSSNIKSVKDDFDGEIAKADKKPEESGTAYYVIDASKLDTSKAGEYKVKVTAADKAGNESTKEFTVKVKEKKEESSSSDNSSSNSSSVSNSSSSKNNSSSTKNNSTSSSSNTSSNKGNTSSSGNSSNNQPQQNCSQVKTKDAWDEQVLVSAAWDETVVDQPAWDETVRVGEVVVCRCGQRFNSYNEWQNHMDSEPDLDSHGGYHIDGVYNTVHHDATYKTIHHDATYKTVHHDAEYTTVCK